MNHFNVPIFNTRLTIAPCSRSATTRSATADNTFLNLVHACKNFVASRRVVSEASCRLHGWLALSIVCAIAFVFVPSASADINGVVTAWGANDNGQCTIPASASSGVSAIAGGSDHTIALKNGEVLAWGYNGNGQCTIPASAQSGVSAIAGGSSHTIALKNGEVLAWGGNGNGQCTIPASAKSGVSAIAGGSYHTIAIKNGEVLAWGYGGQGQCTIPAFASSGVSAIAGGYYYTIALKNGEVLAWGDNGSGQCTIPASAKSGVSAIAGGSDHTIALKNGEVLAWGNNGNGQCTIPASAKSGVLHIAGGYFHTIAIKNGEVLAWGYGGAGQCTIPASAKSGVSAIAGGGNHTIALPPIKDCNNNGIHDPMDVAAGATDLNHDQVPDSCQGAIEYDTTSASLGVPTANVAVSKTFTNLVMPDNFADVPVVISAKGDFDASNEFLTVKLNDVTIQRVFESGGVNCATDAGISTATVQIPFATFANAVAVGQLTITLLPAPAVTASECGNGFMTVQLKYVGIGESGDCNNNGLLDTRDIGANPSLDRDRNALLDACELNQNPLLDCNLNGELDSFDIEMGAPDDDLDTHPDQCQYDKGDFDLDDFVDSKDLGILLLYWLEIDPPFGDFNHDLIIDSSDLGGLLSKFGPVTWGASAPVTEHANKPRDQQMR